jgi:hypothetical protein
LATLENASIYRVERGLSGALTSGAEAIEGPDVLGLVMAKNVVVAVIGADAKIAGSRGVPSAVELMHFELSATKDEAERAFIGAVTRITLDAHLAHGASA